MCVNPLYYFKIYFAFRQEDFYKPYLLHLCLLVSFIFFARKVTIYFFTVIFIKFKMGIEIAYFVCYNEISTIYSDARTRAQLFNAEMQARQGVCVFCEGAYTEVCNRDKSVKTTQYFEAYMH